MPKVVPEYREQAKLRILKAASAEFAKRGYRSTTMNDIAKRLSVSKGAIYQYFDSKEELLGELAGPYIEHVIRDASLPLERDFFEITTDSFGRVVTEMPDWVFGLTMEMYADAAYNKKLKKVLDDLEGEHKARLMAFLDERKSAKELPSDVDSGAVADVLLALETGLMAKLSSGVSRAEAIRTWKEFIKGFSASAKKRLK